MPSKMADGSYKKYAPANVVGTIYRLICHCLIEQHHGNYILKFFTLFNKINKICESK